MLRMFITRGIPRPASGDLRQLTFPDSIGLDAPNSNSGYGFGEISPRAVLDFDGLHSSTLRYQTPVGPLSFRSRLPHSV